MPFSYEPVRIAGSMTVYASITDVWIERPFGTLHGVALINFERVAVWRLSDQNCWFIDLEPETARHRRLGLDGPIAPSRKVADSRDTDTH